MEAFHSYPGSILVGGPPSLLPDQEPSQAKPCVILLVVTLSIHLTGIPQASLHWSPCGRRACWWKEGKDLLGRIPYAADDDT